MCLSCRPNFSMGKAERMTDSIAAQKHSPTHYRRKQRIYYEDTDAGGIVYHSKYLNFMERCRCDWLHNIGFNVAEMQQQQGVLFAVREVKIQYHRPARLFDEITVSCRALQVGKVRLVVEQNIYNAEVLLCSATIKLATLDKTSFKLAAMPLELRAALV